jgi:anthranilate synthase component 1
VDDTHCLTLAADQVTPVRAYAALRSFAPQQTSFLLESLVAPDKGGRYSIIGHRAQSESLYPPGGDALALLAQEIAAAAEPPSASDRPPAEALARRLSRATVGYVTYDAAHPIHKVKPWESEGPMARMIHGSTVVVFDHLAQTCTVAGPTRAFVNRCATEMTRGPELRLLRAPDPELRPVHVDLAMSDETFAARVARAKEQIDRGEIARLVLSRTFRTPPRNAEPFDIYRALRVLSPRPYMFFFDFVATPMVPADLLIGASDEALLCREASAGAGSSAGERVRAIFPGEAIVGSPRGPAVKLVRELEIEPRGHYGGMIGYILPDGELEMIIAQRTVVLHDAYLEVAAGVGIVADSDPAAAADATRAEAGFGLAAIRAAQDAADAREAADAAKRAKEEAQQARAAEVPAPEKAGEAGGRAAQNMGDEGAS